MSGLRQRGERELSNEEIIARLSLQPGVKLYGFLSGLFGRDSYAEKTIKHIKDDVIYVTYEGTDDNGETVKVHTTSRKVDGVHYTWAGIVEDSNRALDEAEGEERPDTMDEYDNIRLGDIWREFLTKEQYPQHCGLCGNHGRIDTRRSNLRTPAGHPVGVLAFCVCPNGRALKNGGAAL